MSNFRIGYRNYADLATLTGTPTLTTTGPVTYLQNDARGYICQASSTASQALFGTWGGTAYTVAMMRLHRHNLAYSDTIRLQLYSDAAWTTQAYDHTALAAYTSGLFDDWGWAFTDFYFAAQSCKSFKITVAASASAFECSRLFLGPYTEATYNPLYGFVPGFETNTKQSRSEGASLRSIRKGYWRTQQFDMSVLTEADRAAWNEIARYCGNWGSFVASLYPGVGGAQERDFSLMGCFEKHPGQKLSDYSRHDFSMKILEI